MTDELEGYVPFHHPECNDKCGDGYHYVLASDDDYSDTE